MGYLCYGCTHKSICKFEEDFKKFSDDTELLKITETVPENFEISINCKFYKPWYEPLSPITVTSESPPVKTVISDKTNPCDECFSNPKWYSVGYDQTGDTPCQWCPNSPFRVTCNN
ncbi:MAG: hypothetical protein J6S67_08600 [Methanobrevibacter sp.]|nr:hypothetical protein [Methanobrevibacter sp.]